MNPARWPLLLGNDAFVLVTSGSRGWAKHYSSEGAKFIRVGNLDHDSISLDMTDVQYVCPPAGSEGERTRLQANDLLISITAELGMVALVPPDFGDAYINQHIALARPRSGWNPRYLAWYFASEANGKGLLKGSGRGGTKAGLGLDDIRNVLIPAAPVQEQKRIADKLDTVLTRVDAVNTRLARVAPLLKRFRQSVLAAATSGRLSEDWRDSCGSSDPADSGLPSTWRVARASDVCASVRDGTHDTPVYVENGIPLVTSKNIGPYGIDFSSAKMISPQDHFEISRRSAVARGDILISMIGTVGQVCLVDTDEVFSIKNVGLFKTSAALCMPRYLFYWLQSPQYTAWLQQNMRGGNQKFISLGLLRESLVHAPPLQEQTEIVRRVETLFAFADRLEARLQSAQTAANRLTPALLAKAFRGELVPQDPNDEPASELLKRLAASAPVSAEKRGRAKVPRAA